MRLMKSSLVAVGTCLVLGSLSWSCFIVPECVDCSQDTGGTGGGTTGSISGGVAGGSLGTGGDGTGHCPDGADKNRDGAIDCADAECAPELSCVPLPDGWEALYDVSLIPYEEESSPCASGEAPEVLFADPVGPFDCTCSCVDGGCSKPSISCWPGSKTCEGTEVDLTNLLADGECHKPNKLNASSLSCKIKEPATPCVLPEAPQGEPLWKSRVGICKSTAVAGCGEGEVCSGQPPLNQARCIRKSGEEQCPSGPFSARHVAYFGAEDQRSCPDCACGDATCEGWSFTVFDNNTCSSKAKVTLGQNVCKDVTDLLDWFKWSMKSTPPELQGTCTPMETESNGEVMGTGAVTLCCQP